MVLVLPAADRTVLARWVLDRDRLTRFVRDRDDRLRVEGLHLGVPLLPEREVRRRRVLAHARLVLALRRIVAVVLRVLRLARCIGVDLVERRLPVAHHIEGVRDLLLLGVAEKLHRKATDARKTARTALVVRRRTVDKAGLLGVVALLEAVDRLLDALLHAGQMNARHLAGLDGLHGPAAE